MGLDEEKEKLFKLQINKYYKKKSRIRETLNLSTDADHRIYFLRGGKKKKKRKKSSNKFYIYIFFFSFFFQINHATSPKLYRSYDPHRSRDLMSPVCGIFFYKYAFFV